MIAKTHTAQLVLLAQALDGKCYIADTNNLEIQEFIRFSGSAFASNYFDVSQLQEPGMYVWEGDILVTENDSAMTVVPVLSSIWTGNVRRATLPDLAKCARWLR